MEKKILIVDDEQDLRNALSTALSAEGFAVIQATDGQEGLDMALAEHPDLIMLDIVMPKLTGLEMLEQLRQDEWGKNANVILLTVLEDTETLSEAMQQGTHEYLVKTDLSLEEIVARVKLRLNT